MLAEELMALAGTSATTLVAAMTTGAWQSARSGAARLFGRAGESRQSIEVQLDNSAEMVTQAADPDRVRRGVAGMWQLKLESLLGQDPGAADDLRALMAQVQAELPPELQAWAQTNIARDGGTVFAVQGGNLVVHESSTPAVPAGNKDTSDGEDAG